MKNLVINTVVYWLFLAVFSPFCMAVEHLYVTSSNLQSIQSLENDNFSSAYGTQHIQRLYYDSATEKFSDVTMTEIDDENNEDDKYVQFGDNGQCVSAIKDLSNNYESTTDWRRHLWITQWGTTPDVGQIIASFKYDDGEGTYIYNGHVAVYLGHGTDSNGTFIWVIDQNWYYQNIITKHKIYFTGSGFANAYTYGTVKIP